jgi:hypothetical protein
VKYKLTRVWTLGGYDSRPELNLSSINHFFKKNRWQSTGIQLVLKTVLVPIRGALAHVRPMAEIRFPVGDRVIDRRE